MAKRASLKLWLVKLNHKYTVINIFLLDYNTRLREWHNLRENLKESSIEIICVEVDKFWQQTPLLKHYLHPADTPDWPNPWELISDNDYCLYARGLGIIYTLMLLGVENIDFVNAIDYTGDNVCLVLVDSAKYVLNWHPDSVLNTSLSNFTNIKKLDIIPLQKKIGKE